MTTIRIRQREAPTETSNASLSFDGGEEFPIQVTDPFSKEEDALLEWYFEQCLNFPDKNATAQQAAASVPRYGESLFRQLFAEPEAYARYKEALQAGNRDAIRGRRIAAVSRPPLGGAERSKLPDAFVLHTTMVRKNLVPQSLQARVKDSPTINVLLIVARPHGCFDVGYRTISKPLADQAEGLLDDQNA